MAGARERLDAWLAARGEAARRRRNPKFPHAVYLEHPASAHPSPRFGHGRPRQPEIGAWLHRHRAAYAALLARLAACGPEVAAFPRRPAPGSTDPALEVWVRERRPARYVEIGSGTSTKVVARARAAGGLPTRITSIDPAPRSEVDALCDRVVRRPLERVDLASSTSWTPATCCSWTGRTSRTWGPTSSPSCSRSSPRLAAGVLVGIHDIFWPDDYPPSWGPYGDNEQYVVGGLLLGAPAWLEPVLPVWYADPDPDPPPWPRCGPSRTWPVSSRRDRRCGSPRLPPPPVETLGGDVPAGCGEQRGTPRDLGWARPTSSASGSAAEGGRGPVRRLHRDAALVARLAPVRDAAAGAVDDPAVAGRLRRP
jgi:hypothetical protein